MEQSTQDLQEIRQDVKMIVEKVHKIDKETVVNTAILKEHQRRSKANEERIKALEQFKWYFAGLATIVAAVSELVRRVI